MFDEIVMAISLGQRLLRGLSALRKDAASLRSTRAQIDTTGSQLDELHLRTGKLEDLWQEQDQRVRDVEAVLKESMIVVEALARRVGTIFWIAVAGCAVGTLALILAAIALGRSIR